MRAELTRVERQERGERLALIRFHAGEGKLRAAEGLSQDLRSHMESLSRDHKELKARLETLTGVLPPNVSLSAMSWVGAAFNLTGAASTYKEALRYAANLRESGLFTDVKVLEASGQGDSDHRDEDEAAGGQISFAAEALVAPASDKQSETQGR